MADLRSLDELSRQRLPEHGRDTRADVLVAFVFLVTLVSFGRYDLIAMLPMALYPLAAVFAGKIPLVLVLKRAMLVLPLVMMFGLLGALADQTPVRLFGVMTAPGGLASMFALLIKTLMAVVAMMALVATSGFNRVCRALERMGMPQVFAMQLVFLYRFMFVLGDEVVAMNRAREVRSGSSGNLGISSYSGVLGHMLLRTWERAEMIHKGMLARGFTGKLPETVLPKGIKQGELVYVIGWLTYFVAVRLVFWRQV